MTSAYGKRGTHSSVFSCERMKNRENREFQIHEGTFGYVRKFLLLEISTDGGWDQQKKEGGTSKSSFLKKFCTTFRKVLNGDWSEM